MKRCGAIFFFLIRQRWRRCGESRILGAVRGARRTWPPAPGIVPNVRGSERLAREVRGHVAQRLRLLQRSLEGRAAPLGGRRTGVAFAGGRPSRGPEARRAGGGSGPQAASSGQSCKLRPG